MNIKKVEKQINKLNKLFQTIKEDGSASQIEKDLLLSYVRNLYERIALDHEDSAPVEQERKVEKAAPVVEEKIPEVVQPKVVAPTPEPIQELAKSEVLEQTPEVATPKQPEPAVEIPVAQSISNRVELSKELQAVFQEASVKELSDKLSQAPIKDLVKNMPLNEKFFTISELFNGDSDAFSAAMAKLNEQADFSAAKDYLMTEVIEKFAWDEPEKIKKVDHFVKFLKRRYS